MKIATVVCLALCVSSPVLAQQTIDAEKAVQDTLQIKRQIDAKAAEDKRAADAKVAADAAKTAAQRKTYQAVNMKIEFTLTDQRGGAAPIKRTVSIIVADGGGGQIRSQSEVVAVGTVPLNIDVNPEMISDTKIRLSFGLQYDWPAPVEPGEKGPGRGTVTKTSMNDRVSLILESGKPMVAAQSADPIGDRTVTVEVKATVLK